MSDLVKRIQVLLRAAPTYLMGAAIVVSAVSDEIAKAFPDTAAGVARVAAPVLAGIAALVAIVRRVTPVATGDRGLLPPGA